MRPFLSACDVVALTSFTEALSLAAIEAMALGRPVVHPEVGGAAEMIQSGQDGWLFPVADTARLVDHLAALADPVRRRAWARTRAPRWSAGSRSAPWWIATSRCSPASRQRKGANVHSYESAQQRIKSRAPDLAGDRRAGFIGSHLAENLLKLGQSVVGLDNFSTGQARPGDRARRARRRQRSSRATSARSTTCRRACAGVEVVLHQAALGSVPRSIDDPISSHAVQHRRLPQHAGGGARRRASQRFVYASSSAVYGDHPGLPKVEDDDRPRRCRPTALTKHVNELYADVFDVCYGFETIGLRYFNVFGPRQDPERRLRRGDPGVDRRAAARPDRVTSTATARPRATSATSTTSCRPTCSRPRSRTRPRSSQAYNVALGDQTTLNELFELIRDLRRPPLCRS